MGSLWKGAAQNCVYVSMSSSPGNYRAHRSHSQMCSLLVACYTPGGNDVADRKGATMSPIHTLCAGLQARASRVRQQSHEFDEGMNTQPAD